ncbi:sigma54 specific transcriptional regulator, Fis family [Desulforamulus reducens MI-1]|uniref:Sigma54 specific transcriptional regulator, Fis family n=1 Tax=Desulforamulus reducens (strain ATCC BAA-1160 / DSM 100696 / MI-1) TaxID=349161 RepID=A4J154_DESRM|nr:sigma 54-interacting transcriptional regulator [Desulforamulus reducens]ABO48807.1 sigma54 specific transcriptional regulator, Fis family [Desulforamulus reducens MI-1]
MAGILLEIQETVEKYASIMAKISNFDVEVVDADLFRVAGTGIFAPFVNMDMSAEGYAYRQVLKTGKLQIIYTPGRDPICQDCPKRHNCTEEIEIAMPILARGKTIGVIGLVGSSEWHRNTILQDEGTYLGLIEQIANFIAAKATERIDQKKQESMLSALSCTIDHMEQGILILGSDRTITLANYEARKQLKLEILEGSQVKLTPTRDKINGQSEYLLSVAEKKTYILGEIYIPFKVDESYAEVLVFTRSKNLHQKMYALTAAISTGNIIGSSEETAALRMEIEKVANSASTVLITGESGTGKEVAATAIWRAGNRRDQQFVALNCAAIPESLLESELFGYVKGAFTGADPNGRIGKFELANHGIVFLDEIGDMPLYLQAKLLRILQDRKIVRIGSNQLIPVDVRVIAATNKDLKSMIADGKFREDLYYRLNVIPLNILPLRQRQKDIPDLANLFAQRYATRFGKSQCRIPPQTMDALLAHPWYGNVRELENTIEFMVNMSDEEGILDLDTLPRDFLEHQRRAAYKHDWSANPAEGSLPPTDAQTVLPLKEVERREIQKALQLFGESTQGKKSAAKSLGISLATLYRKTEEFSK